MSKLMFIKNNKLWLIAVVSVFVLGFFTGTEYKAYQIRSVINEGFSGFSSQISEIPEEEPIIVSKTIGEDVELATIKFKVKNAKEQQIISSKYSSPEVASENAKFVVIDMDVTNITSEPFYFQADGFVVVDNLDRAFNPYGHTIGNIDNYLEMRELAPSIMENGKVVFEIPNDAINYTFNIGKAGTNEEYVVTLK